MPITFKSKHAPNVLMLESVGLQMIKMMGRSPTVPSALAAEDVAHALDSLRANVALQSNSRVEEIDEGEEHDDRRSVSVAHRALPLINMLEAALEHGDHVIWDR